MQYINLIENVLEKAGVIIHSTHPSLTRKGSTKARQMLTQ